MRRRPSSEEGSSDQRPPYSLRRLPSAADAEAGTGTFRRCKSIEEKLTSFSFAPKRASFAVVAASPVRGVGVEGSFKVERTSRAAMKPLLYKHDDALVACARKRSRKEAPPRRAKMSSAMPDVAMGASPGLWETGEEEASCGGNAMQHPVNPEPETRNSEPFTLHPKP